MAGRVIALPELAESVLTADVPDLEVHVWEGQGGHVLADGGHGVELGIWLAGQEEGLCLLVEGRLAGIVETEEDDGVFWWVVGCGQREDSNARLSTTGSYLTLLARGKTIEAFGQVVHGSKSGGSGSDNDSDKWQ